MKLMVIYMAAVALSVTISGEAQAFGFPAFGGGESVDVSSLVRRADAVKSKVSTATISLGEGLADVLELAGKEKDAAELQEIVAATKSDSADFDKIEVLSAAIDKKRSLLVSGTLTTIIPVVAAQSKLSSAVLNIGTAVMADLSVTKETGSLVREIQDAAKAVAGNPFKLRELTSALGAIRFVSSNIIPQATAGGTLIKELVTFAGSHKIPVPSESEMQAKAGRM